MPISISANLNVNKSYYQVLQSVIVSRIVDKEIICNLRDITTDETISYNYSQESSLWELSKPDKIEKAIVLGEDFCGGILEKSGITEFSYPSNLSDKSIKTIFHSITTTKDLAKTTKKLQKIGFGIDITFTENNLNIGSTSKKEIFKEKMTKAAIATWKTAPVLAAITAGLLAYQYLPEFQSCVDKTKELLDIFPLGSKIFAAGILSGTASDLIAQKYEGKPFDYKRSLSQFAIRGASGGVIAYFIYKLALEAVPGTNIIDIATKVFVSNVIFAPPYLAVYFAATNVLRGKREGIIKDVVNKVFNVFPENLAYWTIAESFVYSLSDEKMVYTKAIFSMIWFSYLSHTAYKKP